MTDYLYDTLIARLQRAENEERASVPLRGRVDYRVFDLYRLKTHKFTGMSLHFQYMRVYVKIPTRRPSAAKLPIAYYSTDKGATKTPLTTDDVIQFFDRHKLH